MSQQDADGRLENLSREVDTDLHRDLATADKEAKKRIGEARDDLEEGEEAERHDIVIHASYELFVFGLLIVQLLNSVLLFLPMGREQREIVVIFWTGISVFLIFDVLMRLHRTPRERRRLFTHYNWMTWVGSMPIPFLTGLRVFGLVYVLRKLRSGEAKQIGRVVVSRHAQSTLLIVVFAAVIFFEFGSFFILVFEGSAPGANITTSDDAIWWSLVTISTVGYGDTYPTSYWGRAVGVILIITGVGLFTSITSFLARWFMRPRETHREAFNAQDQQELEGPRAQVREIRAALEDLDNSHRDAVQALEDRLAQLESTMAANNEN